MFTKLVKEGNVYLPSTHALTIMRLINNASDLSVNHHEYVMAKDVIRATKKVCEELGFEIDNDVFEYILDSIGNKPPVAMKKEFSRFVAMIIEMDRKLNKKPLANDYKNYGKFTRN